MSESQRRPVRRTDPFSEARETLKQDRTIAILKDQLETEKIKKEIHKLKCRVENIRRRKVDRKLLRIQTRATWDDKANISTIRQEPFPKPTIDDCANTNRHPARQRIVFRVRGLRTSLSCGSLKQELEDLIERQRTERERKAAKVSITIVPCCYDSGDKKVALVEFLGETPNFLSPLEENTSKNLPVIMGSSCITFDRHFFGFTQLYTPPEGKTVNADVIAITGLDGHAYGSWREKGPLRRMWLRHYLCEDLPRCRTMTYGYNSKLSSHGVATLLDYGRELMEEIRKIRRTEELRKRPLIFVAHSFGGILLAHCLVRAVQMEPYSDPAISSLHKATYGIFFFAVPHRGFLVDNIEKVLSQSQNRSLSALFQEIHENSEILVSQLADFKDLIHDRKIVSFYEACQTRDLVYDSDRQQYSRSGGFSTQVNPASALIQLPDHLEAKIPLHENHSTIVKFDTPESPGYTSLIQRLLQWELEAPGVVAARFLNSVPQSEV